MANDVNFGCGEGAPEAVFLVHLGAAQTTRFTTEGSGFDTVLGVFPTSGGGWCDDDGGPGSTSIIERNLPAGDYWVVVDGYESGGGRRGAYQLAMGHPYVTSGFTGVSWTDATNALASRGVVVWRGELPPELVRAHGAGGP